jgi:phosphoglycolate phosphatase-like HAD superfamily hydrolase
MNTKPNLKNHLFLFDIDGTILDSKGLGKIAFISATEKILDIKIDTDISFLGGIDNVIFKELYYKHNFTKKKFDSYWNKFKKKYSKELSKIHSNRKWTVFPNVDNTIKLLNSISNIALVTGNIKAGAKIKLKKVNLDKYFTCGGFGDSVDNRKMLVKEAIISCQKKFNKKFPHKNIYLFGDTEKDIQSAIENNITPILIDHKKKYKEIIKKLPVKYYMNFLNIDSFLKTINTTY